MVDDLIRYDVLVKDALRDVIRKVLIEVSKVGLPGDHHFFITFNTFAPGVKISSHLKKLYPEQMTIIIQHQFWDLVVTDNFFEINLSFNNTPERLVIPFSAIQCFYDPYASFEAAFNLPDQEISKDLESVNQLDEQTFNSNNVTKLSEIKNLSENKQKNKDDDNYDNNVVYLADYLKKKD